MKLIGLAFAAGLLAFAPAARADAITPYVPPTDTPPCNLCTIDPAVLQTLITGCEAQPGSTSCQILLILVGAPVTAAGAGSAPQP